MVFRRNDSEDEQEDEDGLNIVSEDDDDDDGEDEELFAPGDMCSRCESERGRVGLDPTCHGMYGGDDGPVLFGTGIGSVVPSQNFLTATHPIACSPSTARSSRPSGGS